MDGLLVGAAARTPDAFAVRDAGGVWTYRELAGYAARFAGWLLARGVRPGDRVLSALPPSRLAVAVLFGSSAAGAVLVPVHPGIGDLQVAALLADAEPAVVLGVADESIVDVEAWWSEVLATPALPTPVPRTGDDLALLVYTSGSTAAPKGVMCPRGQVAFAVDAIARRLAYRADDRVFCRLPLAFDYGLYQALLCAEAGAELQLPPQSGDAGLVRMLHDWRSTVVPLVPSLGAMLVRLASRDTRRLCDVRLLTNTGERLDPQLIARLRGCFPEASVHLMFGVTECKRISILEADGDLERSGSVGRPLDGTEVLVVDEDGRPVPHGDVGEFLVRGPHVTAGYWRAPDLTRLRFRRGPDGTTLHTGDFGYRDADGYLYFVGRRDDLFKRHGVRMSVTEIEAATADVEGVRAAALVRPDEEADMTVFVVGQVDGAEVLAQLRRRLEPAKVPARCVVVPALPLTPNGKVDRPRLATLRGSHA
jgi:acyl-CoA synthetase (AMP-forming)/AMP-acid ligase II